MCALLDSLSLTQTCSLSGSLSHALSFFLSLSPSLSQTRALSQTRSRSLAGSLTHSHTETNARTNSLRAARSQTPTLRRSLSDTHTPTPSTLRVVSSLSTSQTLIISYLNPEIRSQDHGIIHLQYASFMDCEVTFGGLNARGGLRKRPLMANATDVTAILAKGWTPKDLYNFWRNMPFYE